jgi:hypothetical protein
MQSGSDSPFQPRPIAAWNRSRSFSYGRSRYRQDEPKRASDHRSGTHCIDRALAATTLLGEEPKILFVLPGPDILTAEAIHPWAAVFLPLHIVITGNDCQSEIQIQNKIQAGRGVDAGTPYGPIVEAQTQLFDALGAVAARPSALG